eukprot:jgi/Chlat1/6528/Chrsp45S06000
MPDVKNLQLAKPPGSSSLRRLPDIAPSIPFAYGTVAFWLGKKADEYHSHRWTCYVRSTDNTDDLAYIIKRVVFNLHPSFAKPTRVVEQPPFQVTETGWGEFEIAITVFFQGDAAEKPVELFHHLKLYPEEEAGPPNTKRPVVVESYDEFVFPEPTEAFYARITAHAVERAALAEPPKDDLSDPVSAKRNLNSIAAAQAANSAANPTAKTAQEVGSTPMMGVLWPFFHTHSGADELARVQASMARSLEAARQQVLEAAQQMQQQLAALEAEIRHLRGIETV